MKKSTAQRKTVEIGSKRIPLKKLLHGMEIRDAAKNLENFRLNFTEKEFLYGGKITVKVDSYGECYAVVHRLETDKEYEDRLEKARLAEIARVEREHKRKLAAEAKALREAETRKQRTLEAMKNLAMANGLTSDDIKELL